MGLAAIRREFRELPLGLIDEPPLPSRSSMDEHKLEELVESIRRDGLQQPMVVARTGERYEVIAGHRRWHACRRAGLAFAPCLIYPSKDAALVAVQFAENYAREELNAADEALWFSELLEKHCDGDVDVLCERLHSKRSYVEGRLLLFQGDPTVFEALQQERIKIGVAHLLNQVGAEPMRRYFLDAAVRGGATESVVKGWVLTWKQQAALEAGEPAAPAPVTVASAIPQTDYFRCACCNGTDNVHLMVPINVHSHCKLAILDKLLAAYNGVNA